MKTKIILAALALVVAFTVFVGVPAAQAQKPKKQAAQFAKRIKNVPEQDMQKALEKKLSQAVTEGKITQTQKDTLIAKLKELRINKAEMKNLTQGERVEKMKKTQEELQKLASDIGIDLKELLPITAKNMPFKRLKK